MVIKEENKLNKATNLISWISYSLEDLEKAKNKLDKNIDLFKKNIDIVTKKASSFAEMNDDVYFEILEELNDNLRDYAQYVSSNIDDTKAIKYSISDLARYNDRYFYDESILKKNKRNVKESLESCYSDCKWIDEYGEMGEPGEIYTYYDLKNYWDNESDNDPLLVLYKENDPNFNFEKWFYDTIGNMSEYDEY